MEVLEDVEELGDMVMLGTYRGYGRGCTGACGFIGRLVEAVDMVVLETLEEVGDTVMLRS